MTPFVLGILCGIGLTLIVQFLLFAFGMSKWMGW